MSINGNTHLPVLEDRKRVGQTLAGIPARLCMTQRQAAAFGVAPSTIWAIEAGQHVNLDTFMRVAVPLAAVTALDIGDQIFELERRLDYLEARLFGPLPPLPGEVELEVVA